MPLHLWLITAWEAGWTSAISYSIQNCGWQLYLQKQFESTVAGLIFTVSGCSFICSDNTVSIIWIYIAQFTCEAPLLALHAWLCLAVDIYADSCNFNVVAELTN